MPSRLFGILLRPFKSEIKGPQGLFEQTVNFSYSLLLFDIKLEMESMNLIEDFLPGFSTHAVTVKICF